MAFFNVSAIFPVFYWPGDWDFSPVTFPLMSTDYMAKETVGEGICSNGFIY